MPLREREEVQEVLRGVTSSAPVMQADVLHVHPKPKLRPGLILAVHEDETGVIFVRVAYGTIQKTDWLPPHKPHGQVPKLGTLHPSMVRIAASAFAGIRR